MRGPSSRQRELLQRIISGVPMRDWGVGLANYGATLEACIARGWLEYVKGDLHEWVITDAGRAAVDAPRSDSARGE
jgi:hypothetical protein